MRLVAAAAGCSVLAAILVAILVLGDEELGHGSGRADGQDHLAVLRGRNVGLVVVLAGIEERGSGGLDGPAGSIASATVVSTIAVCTTLSTISSAYLDGTQDLGGIAGTGSGNNLHGALIAPLLTLATGSSRRTGHRHSGAILTIGASGYVALLATVVGITAAHDAGAEDDCESLKK